MGYVGVGLEGGGVLPSQKQSPALQQRECDTKLRDISYNSGCIPSQNLVFLPSLLIQYPAL